jgi:hypothetical protein
MKRTNAPPIPEGLRIELNGEQEWKDVMQVFEDARWLWLSGLKPHEKQTCSFKAIETTKDERITINASVPITTELTAAQFLQQYQGTIEYEVGDWVVLLRNQCGDPAGTITQITKVIGTSVDVKNVTRQHLSVEHVWSATTDSIRPATPEEIASVTKVEPVAVNKPELYIWDGDVLPDEYWVENPWVGTPGTEFVQLFKKMDSTTSLSGYGTWYYVKNNKYYRTQEKEPDTELPIVPYELWKQILTTPDNQVVQPAVKERMFKKGDRVKVIRGTNKGKLAIISDEGSGGLYWVKLETGETDALFSGENGTGVDIIHYTEEPASRKWKVGDRYCNPEDLECGKNEQANLVGWYIRQLSKDNYKVETADGEDKMKRYSYTAKKIDDYVNRRIWVPYVEKKESTVKKNTVPIGWRPGDSWRHKNNDCGLSISVHPKDDDFNSYFVDFGENGTNWLTVKEINEFVREGLWIINPSQKGRQEEKQEQKEEKQSQTIINKQSKTKQNENIKEGISISTEQCIISKRDYNPKFSAYLPADSTRVTAGPRRKGTTVRG